MRKFTHLHDRGQPPVSSNPSTGAHLRGSAPSESPSNHAQAERRLAREEAAEARQFAGLDYKQAEAMMEELARIPIDAPDAYEQHKAIEAKHKAMAAAARQPDSILTGPDSPQAHKAAAQARRTPEAKAVLRQAANRSQAQREADAIEARPDLAEYFAATHRERRRRQD